MESLKNVVNKVFDLDIMENSRGRSYVYARYVYAKILRDKGLSVQDIGRSINKDHSTIVHYCKQIDFIVKQDTELAEKYLLCKDIFFNNAPYIKKKLKEAELESRLFKLTADYEQLLSERKKILEVREKYRRLDKIIKIIDLHTPEGMEKDTEKMVNKMFN